jgi:hypothetical protein
MSGDAVISGNTVTIYGGGVYVVEGTFTMEKGLISDNKADYDGGGVYVYNSGSFTMNDGEISGNTGDKGGGVCLYVSQTVEVLNGRIFTMNGGEITRNRAFVSGGGVYIDSGIFIKAGGTITGYDSDTVNGNVTMDVWDDLFDGHAVHARNINNNNSNFKETTAGPDDDLYFGIDGTSSGAWDK